MDDTYDNIKVKQYEKDVMKGIKEMVNARRDENELERETTLFNMCDGMIAEIDQLTKGISMGSGIDGSTATNSKRQTSTKYGLE